MMGQKDRRRIRADVGEKEDTDFNDSKKNAARMKIGRQNLAEVATQTFLVNFCFQNDAGIALQW